MMVKNKARTKLKYIERQNERTLDNRERKRIHMYDTRPWPSCIMIKITNCLNMYLPDNNIYHLYSTSTRAGEGAIYRYLSRQGKKAENIHETKSSGLFLS